MEKVVLGIDISKAKFDAVLLKNGCQLAKNFSNDLSGFNECKKWLNDLQCNPHICLESTGIYGIGFATFMSENNRTVSIVNPVQIKRFAESELLRNKTDRIDAGLIARYCLVMSPKAWHPKAKHLDEIKQLVTYLDSLIAMKLQEENRLEHVGNAAEKMIKIHIKQLENNIVKVKKILTILSIIMMI